MNQRKFCKTLAVAVILLFIGMGIQPAVAVEINEENVLIQKIKTQIDSLKNKIDTIEKDENKISKLNPKYKEKFQELYDKITTVNEEINYIKTYDFPILRIIYEIILFLITLYLQIIVLIIGPPLLFLVWLIFFILFSGVTP